MEFLVNKDTKWIEKYFKNNNFDRINNEGGGDCLFAVIRDGLETVGIKVSVQELRNKLMNEATEEIFQNYKEQYDMYKSSTDVSNRELQELIKRNKQLKIELTASDDRSEHKKIIQEASSIKEKFDILKHELAFQKKLLNEWKFMKNITTFELFKELILSPNFWADTWAISILEKILNIKLIIFSFEEYISEKEKYENPTTDHLNIVLCGQLNYDIPDKDYQVKPAYYIMTDYDGIHYQLITYKKRGALTFKELPYKVKELVVERCLENDLGPFSIIADFSELKKTISSKGKGIDLEIIENQINPLYDNDVILQYYSKSFDALPGKGSGEKIDGKNINNFAQLSTYKDWRKKLSNMWIGKELVIDGKKWNTIEHYLNAEKFKDKFPSFYNQFSLDSNSKISKSILAKAAGSKNGKLDKYINLSY